MRPLIIPQVVHTLKSLNPLGLFAVSQLWDAWRLIISVWLPDSLRDAVLTDKPQGVFSDPGGVFASWHNEHAADFTRAMHSLSIGRRWLGLASLISRVIVEC